MDITEDALVSADPPTHFYHSREFEEGEDLESRDGNGAGTGRVEPYPYPYPFSKIVPISVPVPIGY